MNKIKTPVKFSTLILTGILVCIIAGIFATELALKKQYDNRDKNDIYWNYDKILQEPYSHLKITGGNITNIIFEPERFSSVRVSRRWEGLKDFNKVSCVVKNDTLYLNFKNSYKNIDEKNWMKGEVLVRLFAPRLLSVDGTNTNFELQKMKQTDININLKGKSRLEVETYNPNFNNLNVVQSDSSQVIFEISPDLKASPMMHFNNVSANMTGYTLLDIGRSFVDRMKLNISDSSAIVLSGKSLKTTKL